MLSILITTLLLSLSLAAPAPARPAAAIPPCYEIVITTAPPPSTTNSPLSQQTISQTIPSIVTPAPKPDLRHKNRSPQWSSDLLPVETDSDYYWDPDNDPTGFSWPTVYPPWFHPSNTQLTNTARLTVTLGKKQLSPVTWGESVLPVTTEPGYWGEGKTFTFAGQTYTIEGSGKLTITLGHPSRTALAGGVEER